MPPELWAPLPDTLERCLNEVMFIQKELLAWNDKMSMPVPESSLKLQEFNDLDFGLSILLDGRRRLIEMRERWVNACLGSLAPW